MKLQNENMDFIHIGLIRVIWIHEWNELTNRLNTITQRYGEKQQISSEQ
jgi:hypothetical protein